MCLTRAISTGAPAGYMKPARIFRWWADTVKPGAASDPRRRVASVDAALFCRGDPRRSRIQPLHRERGFGRRLYLAARVVNQTCGALVTPAFSIAVFSSEDAASAFACSRVLKS